MKKIVFIILLIFPLICISQIDQTLNNYEINFYGNEFKLPYSKIYDKEFDKYYTGKFLITKLKHSFDQITKRHEIALTASKDSFFESLPDEFGGPAIPDGTKQETNTIKY